MPKGRIVRIFTILEITHKDKFENAEAYEKLLFGGRCAYEVSRSTGKIIEFSYTDPILAAFMTLKFGLPQKYVDDLHSEFQSSKWERFPRKQVIID